MFKTFGKHSFRPVRKNAKYQIKSNFLWNFSFCTFRNRDFIVDPNSCIQLIRNFYYFYRKTGPTNSKAILCPVNTKSVHDSTNETFDIEQFDMNLCTHLIVLDKYWYEEKGESF